MESTAQDRERHAWVDVAKGLCIVLVVMMHSTLGIGEAMGQEGFLHPVVAFAMPFRIPAFFLLSGLFLGRVIGRDWRLFADRRVVHFAYFYLLWLVIQSGFKAGIIVEGTSGPLEASLAFLRHLALALVEPYASLWFIYLLAVFSVVTKAAQARVNPYVLLSLAAMLQALPLHGAPTLIAEFAGRYVFFLIGFLCAADVFAFTERAARHRLIAVAALAVWVAVQALLTFTPTGIAAYPHLASLPALSLATGLIGALALMAFARLLTVSGGALASILRTCGNRSIAIYLAFFLPMVAMRAVTVSLGIEVGIASCLVTAVSVAVPLVLERIVRGTKLGFLFERPAWLHLAPTPPSRLRLQAGAADLERNATAIRP